MIMLNYLKKSLSKLIFLIVFLALSGAFHSAFSNEDTTPPELVDLSFSETDINVMQNAVNVGYTMVMTYDLSPFSGGSIRVSSPSGIHYISVQIRPGNLVLADEAEQLYTYEGTISFSQYVESGEWYVSIVSLRDLTNNSNRYDAPITIDDNPLPTISVTSDDDIEKAVLTRFNISPAEVNTESGPVTITLDYDITDNLSGFNRGNGYCYSPSGPDGRRQNVGYSLSRNHLVSCLTYKYLT
jgi:hypothetical protein